MVLEPIKNNKVVECPRCSRKLTIYDHEEEYVCQFCGEMIYEGDEDVDVSDMVDIVDDISIWRG
jgi:ribosomal protein S27AE